MSFLEPNDTFTEALDDLIDDWVGMEDTDDIIAALEAKVADLKRVPDVEDQG